MNNFMSRLYRKSVSDSLRRKIYKAFLGDILEFFRSRIFVIKSYLYYFASIFFTFKGEKYRLWAFLGKYGLTYYPGDYSLKYRDLSIEVFIDEKTSMPYIIHNNNKLYFPSHYSTEIVKDIYRGLRIEQDENSPHRYVKSYSELKGKTLLDVGSAEGIFALNVIEIVKEVYLFECEDAWINALQATFAPWKSKVTIVKKYVSDNNEADNITIDSFLLDKPKDNLFIKMDIEGAELLALEGARQTLEKAHSLNFSICAYHRENDFLEIPAYLAGYEYEFTNGYLFISWQLRKAMIRSESRTEILQ